MRVSARCRALAQAGFLSGAAAFFAAAPAAAAWRTDSPLPINSFLTRVVAGGSTLYKIGGLGDRGICGTSEVLYARLNADGSAGAWTPTTSLPGAGSSTLTVACAGIDYELNDTVMGWGHELAYSGAHVYALGGNLWNFNYFSDGMRIHFSSAVYYASANTDGSLGAWLRGPDLPAAAFFAAAAVHNGTIYLSGGRDDSTTSFVRRDVYYSRLNSDGSPGPWRVASSPLPGGLWLHAAQAAGGRLYVSGGVTYDPFPRDQITDGVFSAPIAADGDLGVWRAESSLPIGLAGHGLQARHGILYTIGGQEPTWPTVNAHTSPLGADGILLPWTDAAPLPIPLFKHGTAALGDALYAAGGSNGYETQKSVYSLPDAVAPAAIVDLLAEPAGSSSLRLLWTAPGNDGAYGAVAGGRYDLRASPDPAGVDAASPALWSASFEPGQAQSWLLSGLSPDTTYYVSLRAADSAGNLGAASNVASARTLLPPPAASDPACSIAFTPHTLNLNSFGRFVKAVLQGGADVSAGSVRLTAIDGEPTAPLEAWSAVLGDADADGTMDLDVSFDRSAVAARLRPGTRTLTVSGELKKGGTCSASGSLRAISPGKSAAANAPRARFWPAPSALLALKISGSADASLASNISVRRGRRSIVKDRVAVRLPTDALAAPVEITISLTAAESAMDKDLRRLKTERAGLIAAAPPVVFGPEGTRFTRPVTIELPYDPALLPPGVSESRLAVHYWNPLTSEWERLPSSVDRAARLVRAQTSHFSTYQVLAGASAAGSLALVDAYAFPNPVRGSEPVTIRIQPGPADSVTVRVYDLSGRNVHSSSDFTKGAQDTFDHVWNVSGVASGVYIYAIAAHKAGQPDVGKTGKLAVIK